MGGLFYFGAALLPIITVLLLLVVARRPADQAMPVALVVTISISVVIFNFALSVVLKVLKPGC
ncbi:MAG: hypothetical protein HC924_02110 [Synechococcaceae cyanobacterium SM2_3_2]|nr:hypothetical protein [Synechococcaceae cyanobacterium SM2_3_2]